MKKLSTLAALAGALTMTVATVAHAEPKSSSTDKAATPCPTASYSPCYTPKNPFPRYTRPDNRHRPYISH